jgi:hypothetical protein
MTSPAPPTTSAEAYQDVITALDGLVAAITAVLTDPDFIASAGDLASELASAIPGIVEDIVEIAECGADIALFVAG